MFQLLLERKWLTGLILSLLFLSIICQIMIGVIYQKFINEAENLSTTENKQLKQFKLKFQNCYHLNGSVPNIAVFVDKFISRLAIFHISLSGYRQIAAQLVMLSVFVSGVGACLGIIDGEILFRILPYYLSGILSLYLYFSVSSMVDIQRRKENLKINLMDYLENHMLNRLKNNLEESEVIEKTEKVEEIKTAKTSKENKDDKEKPLIYEVPRFQEIKEVPKDEVKDKTKVKDEKIITEGVPREKELKAAIAAFSEDELEDLLKELMA